MAPEQLEGQPADARTDIFAFGALLFEMATGKRAFHGTSTAAVVAAVMAEPRPHATDIDPSLPRILDRIISTCLALKPDDRYQDVRDLLRELRWCEEGSGRNGEPWLPVTSSDSLARPRVVGGSAPRFCRRRRRVLWFSSRAARNDLLPPNPVPVIVLMDSPLPGRVYDPRTAAEGGTNADDVTDALRDLPVAIRKENTSAAWHREEQVVGENPDLIVSHLSCLFDARVGGDQTAVLEHLFDVAENRLLVFLAYVAARNPRTQFIIYSRSGFQRTAVEKSGWRLSRHACQCFETDSMLLSCRGPKGLVSAARNREIATRPGHPDPWLKRPVSSWSTCRTSWRWIPS